MSKTPHFPGQEALRDEASYRSRDLTCDLVMKGGITSGVVYPLAVAELATRYRFRNIGGTSAGAIAAAAAAAAQHRGGAAGFVELAGLPDRLGTELQHVFRPQRRCRRLFGLLLAFTKKPDSTAGSVRKWLEVVARWLLLFLTLPGLVVLLAFAAPVVGTGVAVADQLAEHWPTGLALTLLVLVAIGAAVVERSPGRSSWLRLSITDIVFVVAVLATVPITIRNGAGGWQVAAWFAVVLVSIVLALAVVVAVEAVRVLPGNDYGLVGGSWLDVKRGSDTTEPLSEWLHTLLQGLAGRTSDDAPLTFRDLHDGRQGEDGLNLTLLTTCVSQGRTYYLPYDLAADDDRFYFDPDELRRSMPERVVTYLCELDERRTEEGERDWLDESVRPLVRLPDAADLPVVMATRMSLSFPVLISAVPLRAIDWTLRANRDARHEWRTWSRDRSQPQPTVRPDAERCWFSDGGIISNFPVHLFDSMLPSHPTFGINLRDFHPDRIEYDDDAQPEIEKIWRPSTNGSGMSESWVRWEGRGVKGIAGIASAMIDTLRNWSDNDQSRVPGYRDRIVHVSHGAHEGGLNLAMPSDTIARLGERGRLAAVDLRSAFAGPQPPDGVVTGWKNHKWVRLRSSLALLAEEIGSVVDHYDLDDPTGVLSYRALVAEHPDDAPSYRGTQVQRAAMSEMLEGSRLGTDGGGAEGSGEGSGDEAVGTDGGLTGVVQRLDQRAADHVTASLEHDAPGPRPSLRITPGHLDRPPLGEG